jgi:hypothetical protein
MDNSCYKELASAAFCLIVDGLSRIKDGAVAAWGSVSLHEDVQTSSASVWHGSLDMEIS